MISKRRSTLHEGCLYTLMTTSDNIFVELEGTIRIVSGPGMPFGTTNFITF